MKFKVLFEYMDGKEVSVDIHPDEMERFMATIGRAEVYFNKDKGVGFWIPIDKIRCFYVEKSDEQGRDSVGSDGKLPKRNGKHKRTKKRISPTGTGSLERTLPGFETAPKPAEATI